MYVGNYSCYSVFSMLQEVHHLEVDDVVSIIYGLGVFLQWFGLLRFLSYFDKYNVSYLKKIAHIYFILIVVFLFVSCRFF